MAKSAQRQKILCNMMSTINEHFVLEDSTSLQPPSDAAIVYCLDQANGKIIENKFAEQFKTSFSILVHNTCETLKSWIKGRDSVYTYLYKTPVNFFGTIFLNFNTGTVVIICKKVVYKFYFKDTSFFSKLYTTLKPFIDIQTFTGNNYFLIKSKRYNDFSDSISDQEILLAIQDELIRYDEYLCSVVKSKPSFLPPEKILQLALFYEIEDIEHAHDYLQLSESLWDKCTQFQHVFCHGDLWKGNILEDSSGKLLLTDHDKSLFFCKAYDYVYFYLMQKTLPTGTSLEQILQQLSHHTYELQKFLKREIQENYTEKEISYCIYLFSLLKLSEQDFRHKTYGSSINLLTSSFAKLD